MKQTVILIDGPMGSGKSTTAKLLHERLPRSVLLGMDRIKWFLSGFDRSPEDNAMTAEVVLAMYRTYLSHGVSAIVDQGFMRAEFIQPFIDFAHERHIPVFVYQLHAPEDVLLARLHTRPKPDAASAQPSPERILQNIRTHAEHRYREARVIDTAIQSPEDIVGTILKGISKGISA
jgi:predicted kinase